MKEKELKKNSIKNFVISGVIFIGLIFLTFWLIVKDQDMGEVMGVVQQANLWWILGGLLLMLGYFLVQSWNVKTILGSFGEKLTLRKAFKFTLIEFFFCALTPSASGGQPVEIYYMTKEGISGSSATMAIFVQLCGYQISVVLLGIIAVLFLPYKIPSGVHMFFTIGLLINVAALVILLTCVFSQKVSQVVVKWVIKLARRLKYKKVDQMQQRLEEGLEQYAKSARYIKEHKKEFVVAILRVLLQVTLYFLVPFCIYSAFGLNEHNVIELFAMQSVLFLATAGFPIPGAVGLSETVFLALYGTVFGEELINSAMLLNRGVTFYGFVIIGLLVVVGNIIFLRIRAKRTKKKGQLSDKGAE